MSQDLAKSSILQEDVTRKKLEIQRAALQDARRRLIADAVSSNAPESVEQILDTDLLAFVIATTFVKADRYFFELESTPSQFCGNFRLDAKSVLIDVNCFHGFPSESFVARFHVR